MADNIAEHDPTKVNSVADEQPDKTSSAASTGLYISKDSVPQPAAWSDTKDYEFHPLSERFPLMEGDEFEDFADDLATNGQKETVKLFEGKILDGRNRYRACKDRGIPCRFEHWNGEGDPGDYVLSMNLHRRHLTPEARQELVIQLRKEGKSIRQIAETLHTSVGSVHRDIGKATVQRGTVATEELPTTITGKDGKTRQARKPKKRGVKGSDTGAAKPGDTVSDGTSVIHGPTTASGKHPEQRQPEDKFPDDPRVWAEEKWHRQYAANDLIAMALRILEAATDRFDATMPRDEAIILGTERALREQANQIQMLVRWCRSVTEEMKE